MYSIHKCPQCKEELKLVYFSDEGICTTCTVKNIFNEGGDKPQDYELEFSKNMIAFKKKHQLKSDSITTNIDSVFNSNLSQRPSVNDVRKAARLSGSIQAENSMLRARRIYCSTPGCTTKLKNKYASICSYCKAKNGWYNR